jgi:hypothetical protein
MVLIPCIAALAAIARGAGIARVSKDEFVKAEAFETAAKLPPQGEGKSR